MANKGTQALLMSDVSIIRETTSNDVDLSVSTTDVEGVKRLRLPLNAVLPSMVDIPYERADSYAKRVGLTRESARYKISISVSFICMLIQIPLSLASAFLVKAGLKGVYRSRILERIRNANLVVSCSDENFKETASMLPLNLYWMLAWWSMLTARTMEILIARIFTKPIVMFPNTVGPFRTSVGRTLSKLALNNCSLVMARDSISYETLKSLMVIPPKVLTSDSTLLFKSSDDTNDVHVPPLAIGVSVGVYSNVASDEAIFDYVRVHAEALDEVIENHGVSVLFLPHYISGFHYDDLEISKLVLEKMKNVEKARIVDIRDAREFSSIMKGLSLIVSSKMHPAVLAVSHYVPFLFEAYDYKQTGFAASLDMNDCVIPIRQITRKLLVEKINYILNERERIRALLMERIPEMQNNVKQAITKGLKSYLEA
jgi:polysaccharide pyruvyl transferase WcaK-like protein